MDIFVLKDVMEHYIKDVKIIHRNPSNIIPVAFAIKYYVTRITY